MWIYELSRQFWLLADATPMNVCVLVCVKSTVEEEEEEEEKRQNANGVDYERIHPPRGLSIRYRCAKK